MKDQTELAALIAKDIFVKLLDDRDTVRRFGAWYRDDKPLDEIGQKFAHLTGEIKKALQAAE